MIPTAFGVYRRVGVDGYPPDWHRCTRCDGTGEELSGRTCEACWGEGSIKALVRALAEHRCVRCGHPYRVGEHGNGEWSPCDVTCTHGGPVAVWAGGMEIAGPDITPEEIQRQLAHGSGVEAHWRILTVHHLDNDKANCRWWNLAALCQRCHLEIQGRVRMERPYWGEHTEWFRPYVAGYYAWTRLGLDLTREEVDARLDELLDLEHRQLTITD